MESHLPLTPSGKRLVALTEKRMLDTLTEKLSGVFRNLSGRGRLSEENIREALRDVRTALLEANVNFKVVKDFTDRVQEKAIGQEVIKSPSRAS